MVHLDRKLQLALLTTLREHYPEVGIIDDLFNTDDYAQLQGNLTYLEEHGLIEPEAISRGTGVPRAILTAKITAQGLDFLEADGGLSAILGAVTIKFDAENIRQILEDKVIQSELPQLEKETLLAKVRGFSGDLLKGLIIKAAEKALDKPQDLARIIDALSF